MPQFKDDRILAALLQRNVQRLPILPGIPGNQRPLFPVDLLGKRQHALVIFLLCGGRNVWAALLPGWEALPECSRSRIHLLDFIDDDSYRDLLCAASLFAMLEPPSPFFSCMLEAMSCGAALVLPASGILREVLTHFLAGYDPADEMSVWFDKIKKIADGLGFASDMKAYKAAPEDFRGSVADVSSFIRVAVTGKQNAPDLYTVMQILGETRTRQRIEAQIAALS